MRTPTLKLLLLSALLLPACLTPGVTRAADTLLFDNLRAFGQRWDVGDPEFTSTNEFDPFDAGPKDVTVADLNGDTRPDFVASNKDGSLTVYFNNGAGGFNGPTHLRTGGGELRGLVCADFTGNGHRDIAVGAPFEGVVYLFVNLGGGNFAPATSLPAWVGARDLVSGDFDGDGLADLAVSGTTNGVSHWRNLGGANFQVMTNLAFIGPDDDEDFPQPAYYLKRFRMPASTRDEVVVGRAQSSKVRVLAIDGDGRLAVQGTLTNMQVNALDVGPLLRPASEGVPDLIVAHNDRGTVEIHSALGTTGRFNQNTNQQFFVPGGPRNIRIADLDGDGWNDLIVVLQRFNKVRTFRNDHGVFIPTAEASVGIQPREMDLGDFNDDGHPDAAILNRFSSDVSIRLTHPGVVGFSVAQGASYPVEGDVSGLEVRDFDGDGLDDVLQLHRASAEFSVRLATNNGVLLDPVYFGLGLNPSSQSIADVNHDGIEDLITVEHAPYISVRLGLGQGQLGPETQFPVPNTGGRDQLFVVTTADFDHDGHVDVAVGYFDCRIGFYIGHGDGTFSFTVYNILIYEPRAMAAGDFDQDGDMDLAAASINGDLAVIENTGDIMTTTSLAKVIYANPNHSASTMKAVDQNDDGDIDLIVAGYSGLTLFLGSAGMGFTLAPDGIGLPNLPASTIALADYNGDGLLDIAATCMQPACLMLSLGVGDGVYETLLVADIPSTRLLAAGDLDGDGFPDLVGTGDSLWVILSGTPIQAGPPPPLPEARSIATGPVINELLARNVSLTLDADGGRNSDWLEVFHGGDAPQSLAGWRLQVIETTTDSILNPDGTTTTVSTAVTNEFAFPPIAMIQPGAHQLVIFANTIRSPYHTGFKLPGDSATLLLLDDSGAIMDRVAYGLQADDIAYGRFRDGMTSFVASNLPTPGQPNGDSGPVPPTADLDGVDLATLDPDRPVRFYAQGLDDIGVASLVVVWCRLDAPDGVTRRSILYDDGMHEDGGMLDGTFSGLIEAGLPPGAEIQFYLECIDVSDQLITTPNNAVFAPAGQVPSVYTLAVRSLVPGLEISEFVSENTSGLQDEEGGTPDWIEIRNGSANPIAFEGISLGTQFFGNSDRLAFDPSTTLGPGEHLVIYADANPEQGPRHAPFKLNEAGEQLALTGTTANGARQLLDSVSFGPQKTDRSYARAGYGGPWRITQPTPGSQNVAGSWDALSTPDTFTFVHPTDPTRFYMVEWTESLDQPAWNFASFLIGTGLENAVTEPKTARRFYRVFSAPLP